MCPNGVSILYMYSIKPVVNKSLTSLPLVYILADMKIVYWSVGLRVSRNAWNLVSKIAHNPRLLGKGYDFLPPDGWFMITPSVWAFISGAFISVGVNLITGLMLSESKQPKFTWVSAFLFIVSAIGFISVNLIVENCRAKVKPSSLLDKIHERKSALSFWFLLGFISLISSLVFISLWH